MGWAILFAQMAWESRVEQLKGWLGIDKRCNKRDRIINTLKFENDALWRRARSLTDENESLRRNNYALRNQADIMKSKLAQQERFFAGNAPVTYFKDDHGNN